jgi:HAD superfamily hydrolase (TIGR01549 family)
VVRDVFVSFHFASDHGCHFQDSSHIRLGNSRGSPATTIGSMRQHERMTDSKPVSVILMDLDDTLIVEEEHAYAQLRATSSVCGAAPDGWDEFVVTTARSIWRSSAYQPVCDELGIASWEGLWATFEGAHPRIAALKEYAPEYRDQAWRAVLEQSGHDPALAPEMSRAYVEGQRAGHPVAKGAAELVDRAVEIAPVVVVTNGPPDIQRLKIVQTGLADRFSGIVISGELGRGKPDPEVFRHAIRLAGFDRAEDSSSALMIGDSWERDVMGAISAGVRPIWISHGRTPPHEDPRVRIVDEVTELTFTGD